LAIVGTNCGSLQCSHADPIAGLKGPTSKGGEKEIGEGYGEKRREEEGRILDPHNVRNRD